MQDIVELIKRDPQRAAEHCEHLAEQFKQLAARLRNGRNPSSLGDRVSMELIGPDGTLKQRIDA